MNNLNFASEISLKTTFWFFCLRVHTESNSRFSFYRLVKDDIGVFNAAALPFADPAALNMDIGLSIVPRDSEPAFCNEYQYWPGIQLWVTTQTSQSNQPKSMLLWQVWL